MDNNNENNLTLEQLMQSVAVPQENHLLVTVIDASAFHNQVQTPSVPVDSNLSKDQIM